MWSVVVWCTLVSPYLRDLIGLVGLFTHEQEILLTEIYSLASETENNSAHFKDN